MRKGDAFRGTVSGEAHEPVRRDRLSFWILNLAAVLTILVVDWLTPAGVVVGILLGAPILVTSASRSRAVIWVTFGLAVVGFIVAATFGRGPISPEAVWVPNRVLALAALTASGVIALHIQARRLESDRRRDEAIKASRLNELLVSLVAHDLRAPLAMAIQALDYATEPIEAGDDDGLLRDVGARLRRNLGSIDVLLQVARHELSDEAGRPTAGRRQARLARELEAEVGAFRDEATQRDKTLVIEWTGPSEAEYVANVAVLRQAVAILLDNAIRYASPGPIVVRAGVIDEHELFVSVSDAGPADPREGTATGPVAPGSGLGLALCRALLGRAGGRLDENRTSRRHTTFTVYLPVEPGDDSRSEPGPAVARSERIGTELRDPRRRRRIVPDAP